MGMTRLTLKPVDLLMTGNRESVQLRVRLEAKVMDEPELVVNISAGCDVDKLTTEVRLRRNE